MELSKEHHTHNALLRRDDAVYRITTDGATPSRLSVVEAIAKKEKGTVIVRHVYQATGSPTVVIHASVYADAAIATAVEQPKLLAKQQKPVAAAAPAEA